MRYILTGDDSGHEYAVPIEQRENWYAWLDSEDAQVGGNPPEWAIRIDGRFTFSDPKVE